MTNKFNPIDRRKFLKTIGLGAAAVGIASLYNCLGKKQVRPNILFIMTDDHAPHAMSCYGSKVNTTPNLDRIANEGIRLDNCYCTNSICGPSRAVILTGKYSHINGFKANEGIEFDGSQPTLPKILQKNGYQTALIGKWHLGSEPTGFDYYTTLPNQGRYYAPRFIEKGNWPNAKEEDGYVTDIITDKTIDWLDNRDTEKPFFLMCHQKAPHRSWRPDEKHWKLFKDKHIPEPGDLLDRRVGKSDAVRSTQMEMETHMHPDDTDAYPPEGLAGDELTKWRYQKFMRKYLACVASVDDNVGRLLDYLDKSRLSENTIVVYTSDQGFFIGDHGFFDKRIMYEEALQMPFVMKYPKGIKSGSISTDIMINADFAPTFLEYAGIEISNDIQGRSFKSICSGKTPEDWRQSMYYRYYGYPDWHMVDKHYGIRTKTHKLIHFYGYSDEWEFYDLQKDPTEKTNEYNNPNYQKSIAKLKTELYGLMEKYKDEKPIPGQMEKLDKIFY